MKTNLSAWAMLALVTLSTPAWAQWTPVPEVASTDVFSVTARVDTLVACRDSTIDVSTDGGVTWKHSLPVASGLNQVHTAVIRNGQIYVGTDRQGVFVTSDLGDTWADFSQGISGLGSFDIAKLMVRGDSIYAATIGGGPWVRNLTAGPWIHFGNEVDNAQGGNMTTIAAGGSRLFAAGGFNGSVFFRDPGQPDWTESLLFNDRLAAGLAGLSAIWNGHAWIVGSNIGIFHSATGQAPWTFVDFGLRPVLFVGLALDGTDVYASLGTGGGSLITMSRDDGGTWQNLDTLASVFVYDLARVETTLYAGRVDGLWRRSIANVVSVPPGGGSPSAPLTFAIAGAQPIGDRVRFTFELPDPGPIAIQVFDVEGRRVGDAIRETRPAGHGETSWDASRLSAGVYYARLTAAPGHATARLVRAGRH
jgi:hypothetical protein